MRTLVFIALFMISKRWRKPKYLLMDDEWIDKMWYVCPVSALKRKEVLTHATAWLNLENIRLREVSDKKTNTV